MSSVRDAEQEVLLRAIAWHVHHSSVPEDHAPVNRAPVNLVETDLTDLLEQLERRMRNQAAEQLHAAVDALMAVVDEDERDGWSA